ncbi:MAG: hypothetical protein VB122_06390, partial [Erysipelotrichales bacterium]|nr:hypothetical protein [Erysipelotrichales bacterium]
NIYVIECKDMALKITPKKISNTENKFRKEYNKKLKGKIDEIRKHKDIVLKHLGDDDLIHIDSEVHGLYVLSEYFNSSKEIVEYPSVLWTQLIEYLNKE